LRADLRKASLDFADASSVDLSRRGGCGAFAPRVATPPTECDAVFVSKTLRAMRRYAFFLRELFRFAVLRAVFFAADFVFDFDFFAILPS